ncbi:hypothetical protein HNP82_002695 [Catenibacillus scindens]|uniref:Uncharacterized protein n=1 Tax=Catenibacillus scindens TaxID=673271 RepID=A0A7W8HBZ0_9FIRM|nr:hypothetical protein [Catenibacillus scindens]MBB5265549.1 hypothetical protein [Catenibacillus scindens]
MNKYTIKYNELSAEEFILLWETVWGPGPSLTQTKLAMEHTLFRISIFDKDKIPFYQKFGFNANEAQRLKMMYPVK